MKTNTIYGKAATLAVMLLALVFSVSNTLAQTAQVKNYGMQSFSGKYATLSGGTLLGSGDDNTYSFVQPFDFNYDSVKYSAGSTMYVNTNGVVKFGSTIYCCEYSNYMGTTTYPNQLGVFQADMYVNTGIYYQVTGNAPSRILTIEFVAMRGYSGNGSTTNMEVIIYETTNVIEYWYRDLSFNMANYQASGVGLNGTGSGNWLIFQGSSTSTPSSNVRFTPPIPLPNVQLSTSPKTIDFGFGLTGQIVDKQMTVTHAGTEGTLTISSTTVTGNSDFTVVPPLPGPLSPGQSANITVRFIAQVDGTRTGTLTVFSNGRDSGKQSISLTAKGIAPNILVDSTVLFKKTRTRLGDTIRQWIHITSVGQASLFLLSYPITGIDADQYFISYFPTSPIAPGGTDSLQVSYVPTREGLRAATLTINNNSFNNPALQITLRGTGILPHIVVTPPLLLFDSTKEGQQVCKNITIWNPGSDTLKIKSNTLSSNDGDFQYTGLTAPTDVTIPPDQTRTVTICFTPIQQGERQARLQFLTNIIKTYETPRRDTGSLVTVDIRGTGVPFGVFNTSLSGTNVYDSAFINKPACRTATLTNSGDADILVQKIDISGTDALDFSYSGLPAFPFLLKARASVTFTICGTPDKQGLLSAIATVTGTSSGSTTTGTLNLQVFGIKACVGATPSPLFATTLLPMNGSDSTLCVTVNNCGDLDAIYKVKINGTNASDYTVTPLISGNVTANTGTTQFCVKFKPSAIGASKNTTLDIVAADNSASVSVPLVGSGGCAVLTNDAPVVPATGDNETQTFTFNVSNVNGTFDWTPGTETITPATAFSLVSVVPNPIPAGQSGVVTMKFHPALGTQGSTLTAKLEWPNAGPCGNSLSIDLSGVVVQSSVKEAATDGFSLDQSYPNPTQGNATFTYTTPRETEVRISVVDLTGKLIRTLITGRVSEGPHTVNFDVAGIASGTYIYMLESGSTKLVKQLILAR